MSEIHPSLGQTHGQHTMGVETKGGLVTLRRLQDWVGEQYGQLSASLHTDVTDSHYLRVTRAAPHPVLVTQPSLSLVCRVDTEMRISCLVQSFNMINIKEIHAYLEEGKVTCVYTWGSIHGIFYYFS